MQPNGKVNKLPVSATFFLPYTMVLFFWCPSFYSFLWRCQCETLQPILEPVPIFLGRLLAPRKKKPPFPRHCLAWAKMRSPPLCGGGGQSGGSTLPKSKHPHTHAKTRACLGLVWFGLVWFGLLLPGLVLVLGAGLGVLCGANPGTPAPRAGIVALQPTRT